MKKACFMVNSAGHLQVSACRKLKTCLHASVVFSSSWLCLRSGPVEDILAEMCFPSSAAEAAMKPSVLLSPTRSGLAQLHSEMDE